MPLFFPQVDYSSRSDGVLDVPLPSSIPTWQRVIFKIHICSSHVLSPSVIPYYIHSKIPSSLCGIWDQLITVHRQEKDSILSHPISKHEYCSNNNENYLVLTFLLWLRLFFHYFNTLPPLLGWFLLVQENYSNISFSRKLQNSHAAFF